MLLRQTKKSMFLSRWGGGDLPSIRVALEKAVDQEPDKKTSSPTGGPPLEFFIQQI